MKTQPTSIQSCSRDGDENGRTTTHHYPKDLGRWILVFAAILLLSSTLCEGKRENPGKPPKEEPPEEEPPEEEPSNGITYYVAIDGDDRADGLSLETTWKTIQKAADTMVAGDTVNIRGGVYQERIMPLNSGDAINGPITYQAYSDKEVIIESPNAWAYDYCIYLRHDVDLSYLHFKNLTLRKANCANFGAGVSTGIKRNIVIENITSYGSTHPTANKGWGIYFWNGVENSKIINCEIYDNDRAGIFLSGNNSNITIADNHIYSNYDNIVLNSLGSEQNSTIFILNNEIAAADRQGVLILHSNHVLVRNNHCHHNGATGIQIESEGNSELTQYIVVEGNICEYNSTNSLYETGIWIDDTDYALVQNNILRYNIKGLAIAGSRYVIARNNTIYENSGGPDAVPGGIWVWGSSQRYEGWGTGGNTCALVHNTIHRNGHERTRYVLYGPVVIGYSTDTSYPPVTNIAFRNNIISESLSENPDIELRLDGTTHILGNNNYYNTGDNTNISWNTTIYDWEDYQSVNERNSIASNPSYVSFDLNHPNNAIFALDDESPCIDTADYLTFTGNGGFNANFVDVNDARYFCDGYGLIEGDRIQINNDVVQVVDVNETSNTLTIDRSLTWLAGDAVSYPYAGTSPDMGAFEYGVLNTQQQRWSTSIQSAIDSAADGESIVLYPGTYTEQIDFLGKAITLRSSNPNDWAVVLATVIDANDIEGGIGVTFASEEGINSVLRGLTVRGGKSGVLVNGANTSPRIERCIIEANSDSGILCSASTPLVTRCIIRDHTANNDSSGIYSANRSTPYIANNWIYGNNRGIHVSKSRGLIYNNTLADNSIGIEANQRSSPIVNNCILWNDNNDLVGCSATFSCIKDGDGGLGNISVDPGFAASAEGDYHLQPGSACINAGDNETVAAADRDIDGDGRTLCGDGEETAVVDMGADEYVFP